MSHCEIELGITSLTGTVNYVRGMRTENSGRQLVMRKLVASSRTAPNLKSLLNRMRGEGFARLGFRPSMKEVSSLRLPASAWECKISG